MERKGTKKSFFFLSLLSPFSGPKYLLLPRSFGANEERSPPSSSSFYSDPSPDRKTELVISRIDYEEEEEATAFPPRHRWRKRLEVEQLSGAFSGRASVLIKEIQSPKSFRNLK